MGAPKGVPHKKWRKEEKLKWVRLHLDEHISIRRIEKECILIALILQEL